MRWSRRPWTRHVACLTAGWPRTLIPSWWPPIAEERDAQRVGRPVGPGCLGPTGNNRIGTTAPHPLSGRGSSGERRSVSRSLVPSSHMSGQASTETGRSARYRRRSSSIARSPEVAAAGSLRYAASTSAVAASPNQYIWFPCGDTTTQPSRPCTVIGSTRNCACRSRARVAVMDSPMTFTSEAIIPPQFPIVRKPNTGRAR